MAALLTDLRRRGMLDIHWSCGAAELVARQRPKRTREKIAAATTIITDSPCGWREGGVRGGVTYGETDDFGFRAVENRVHIHDMHATILHLMGLDHERLTYRYAGRDFRLTDVAGNVLHSIIA